MHTDDQLAIRDLTARFTDAVNRGSGADLAVLFTDDGEWHVPGVPTIRGRAAIAAQLDSLLTNFGRLVQLTHSGHVDVHGDTASGVWYLTEHAADDSGTEYAFTGVYSDQLVRTQHGWRFGVRRFDFLHRAKRPATGKWYAHPRSATTPSS